jgi:ABC-type antimicrobial peptide transport system permease subunit
VRTLIAERDPRLAMFAVRTSADLVANAVSNRRLLLWLVAWFAAIGVLVAVVGLYGTVAYNVAGRTREMAVRIALGATSADIRRLVVAYGLRVTAGGIVIGLAGAISMRQFLESQLFGVTSTNGLVLVATAALLLAASVMAALAPSRRAVRVDPSASLRSD